MNEASSEKATEYGIEKLGSVLGTVTKNFQVQNNLEKTMTTKELAQVLGVDVKTIQRASEKLFDKDVIKSISTGGRPTQIFTQEQATMLKKEIAKHHNLASRQVDTVSTEYGIVKACGAASQVQNNLEKTMTTKELAQALNVSVDTVTRTVAKILDPSAVQRRVINGGQSMIFDEVQATMLKKEIAKHHNLASRQVDTVSTETELFANYKKATEALVDFLKAKNEELLAQNGKQQERIGELENQVEYNKVIDCRRWTDVKKEYRLTKLNKAKVKEVLKEEVDWFEKCMGKDKFPTLLIKPQAIIKLVQINSSL